MLFPLHFRLQTTNCLPHPPSPPHLPPFRCSAVRILYGRFCLLWWLWWWLLLFVMTHLRKHENLLIWLIMWMGWIDGLDGDFGLLYFSYLVVCVMHAMDGLGVIPSSARFFGLPKINVQHAIMTKANERRKKTHTQNIKRKKSWNKKVSKVCAVHVLYAIDQKISEHGVVAINNNPTINLFLCCSVCHILIDNRKHRWHTNHIQQQHSLPYTSI